jgi:hypothetical protein
VGTFSVRVGLGRIEIRAFRRPGPARRHGRDVHRPAAPLNRAVDPVEQRLVPVIGLIMRTAA